MPARTVTPEEAVELDGRKKCRAAKAAWDAKEKAVADAKAAALVARREYEAIRNDLIRQYGPG